MGGRAGSEGWGGFVSEEVWLGGDALVGRASGVNQNVGRGFVREGMGMRWVVS